MPMVMVPFPAPRLQVGGFVMEVVFGKMPVMTKQVSPQPSSKKQRSRLAPQSRRKRGWVCRGIGVLQKERTMEASSHQKYLRPASLGQILARRTKFENSRANLIRRKSGFARVASRKICAIGMMEDEGA